MGVTYLAEDRGIGLAELESLLDSGGLITGPAEPAGERPVSAMEGLEAVMPVEPVSPLTEPFTPIGIGKPLSIRIHTMYPGELPGRRRQRSSDILVVSGLKAEQTFDKTSRMINLLERRVGNRKYLQFSAFLNGSQVVHYTPALTDAALLCSFDVVPDTFNDALFGKIANLFQMASGMPIFAPAGAYLVAGSFLTKMFSDLGRVFLEKGPVLTETLKLNFGIGGTLNFKEGLYVVHNFRQSNEFEDLKPAFEAGSDLVLRDTSGKTYQGNAPYMLIGVDGKEEPHLENLSQQAASAAMLEDFYPSSDSAGVLINEFAEALQLLNDLKFKKKADALRKRMDGLSVDDPKRAEFSDLLAAYERNILLEEFKQVSEKCHEPTGLS